MAIGGKQSQISRCRESAAVTELKVLEATKGSKVSRCCWVSATVSGSKFCTTSAALARYYISEDIVETC
jgi:hypothetical protein